MNYFLLFSFFLFNTIRMRLDLTNLQFPPQLQRQNFRYSFVPFNSFWGFVLSYFSVNFHCIPVSGEIYSLEHSMHSLLRLNEITFNALISQQRTFT